MDQWCTNPASNQGLDIDLQLNLNLLTLVSKIFFLSPQTRHFTDKNFFRLLEEKAERKPLKAGFDVRCCSRGASL